MATPRTIKGFGWIRDIPSKSDVFLPMVLRAGVRPALVDLRDHMPPVYDQGELGSCTANATAAAVQYAEMQEKKVDTATPSRLMIYYCERALNGTTDSDSGAQLRDGAKVVSTVGVVPETDWPYDINKFTDKPPAADYALAATEKVRSYFKVSQDLVSMKQCLADGFPFTLGFAVYQSFMSDLMASGPTAGVMHMPAPGEECVGGHAVLCVGYDDVMELFFVRNSWGAAWGAEGYFYMPYDFMVDTDYVSDLWTFRSI